MLLRRRIERYLQRTGTTASSFGRDALGDPGFVADLRKGRKVREKTAARIRAWLDRKAGKR